MSSWSIGYGALLSALGVGGYFATGQQSKTALIPAGFGVAAIGIGVLARNERFRKPALVAAAVVGLAGLGGSVRGLAKLPALLRGDPIERPAAVVSQSIMAGLSAVFLAGLAPSLRKK